jgi:hypothetical protein
MDYDLLPISVKECEIIDAILSMKTIESKEIIDRRKLVYNNRYASFEYWASKWPDGYDEIPCMNLVIKDIYEKNKHKTPLEEIEKIKISER